MATLPAIPALGSEENARFHAEAEIIRKHYVEIGEPLGRIYVVKDADLRLIVGAAENEPAAVGKLAIPGIAEAKRGELRRGDLAADRIAMEAARQARTGRHITETHAALL